jgi:3'-phosphoadenosine 5'-phosphosulfate sulfotransferase (PAPS reductase)/FAD synthetase
MNLDMFYSGEESAKLTVLSMGMGQDSTALLYKYVYDKEFRDKYAPNDFLVIFADTGNEFPQTYDHLAEVKLFCIKHEIAFVHLTPAMGFHTGDWQSLEHFYETKEAVGSKAYPKICSQRLKIEPIYRYLEVYLGDKYGVRVGKKVGFRQFAAEFGKIRMMIGIAKNEEKRMSDASQRKERWYSESIEHQYPLVDLQMDRKACQDYIKSVGHKVPIPSNCMMCPFLSEEELEYLRRFEPAALEKWIYFEKRKLHRWSHLESVPVNKGTDTTPRIVYVNKNLGVWGKKYLPEMVNIVAEKFKAWTDDMIIDYRMSHGHCVASAY